MSKDGTDKKKYEAPVIIALGELSMSSGAQCADGSTATTGSCGAGLTAAPACNSGGTANAACVAGQNPGTTCVGGPAALQPCSLGSIPSSR